ncbi:ATP phosphoribosyltransferase [Candidatus Vidania fulgoroideorum]
MILSVSKGRIFNSFKLFLKKKNINIEEEKRKLILKTNKKFNIALLKQEDILYFLLNKHIDAGLIGYDFFLNNLKKYKDKICVKKIQKFFSCGLYLIRDKRKSIKKRSMVISTKYDIIVNKFFKYKKLKIIKMNGSNELAISLNVSDYIVDIVDTGTTLKNNYLKKIYKIVDIFPLLVYLKKNENIILNKLEFIL